MHKPMEKYKPLTILFAEDEQLAHEALLRILRRWFGKVHSAFNGQEAAALFHEHQGEISVVLTDIDMPLMDGFELTQMIKSESPECPVIFVSAFKAGRDGQVSADGYVEKPVDRTILMDTLERVLGR